MKDNYKPRGKTLPLLAAFAAEPDREWTGRECAELMDCDIAAVSPLLLYAERAGIVIRRRDGKRNYWSHGSPVPKAKPAAPRSPLTMKAAPPKPWVPDPTDPRIMRVVPGWTPPKMVCVRGA